MARFPKWFLLLAILRNEEPIKINGRPAMYRYRVNTSLVSDPEDVRDKVEKALHEHSDRIENILSGKEVGVSLSEMINPRSTT